MTTLLIVFSLLLLIVVVWSLKPPSITPLPAIRRPTNSDHGLNRVIDRLLTENKREMTNIVKKKVEMTKEELLNNKIVPPEPLILSDNNEDTDVGSLWSTLIGSYTQWSDLPDEIARGYLDYKLFRTLDGWQETNTPYDFFIETKFQNVKRCQAFVEEVAMRLPDALVEDNPYDALSSFMNVCLWSLSKELPLISVSNMESDSSRDVKKNGVSAKRRAFFEGIVMQQRMLLQDDSNEVMEALSSSGKSGDVAIILNNTGKELMGDLALAYTLLALKLCDTVTLYAKRYTTSEYGATAVDVAGHISHLADPRNSDVWAVRHLGESLRTYVYNGQLQVEDDSYWCLPPVSPYWEMPLHLEKKLSRSKLVFIKGDLNYRRMLGDREWPLDSVASDVLSYWHVPICALRILESNVACGIHPKISSRISKQDQKYLTNGQWGMIQFVPNEIKTELKMETKQAENTAEPGLNQ